MSREGNRLSYRGRVGGDGVNGGGGGLLEGEVEVYVILSSASLASLSSEKSTWFIVVLASMASEALSPNDHVERPLSRHQVISEAADAPEVYPLGPGS